jgi:hypothetical protein
MGRIAIEPTNARATADRLRRGQQELHSIGARLGARRLPVMPPGLAPLVDGQLTRQRINLDQRAHELTGQADELIRRAAIAEIAGGDAQARSFVDLMERGGIGDLIGPEGVLLGLLTPKWKDALGVPANVMDGLHWFWEKRTFVRAPHQADGLWNMVRQGRVRNYTNEIKSHAGAVRSLGKLSLGLNLAIGATEVADAWKNHHGKDRTKAVGLEAGEQGFAIAGGFAGAAATGALIGSVVPGPGTVVGAVGAIAVVAVGGYVGGKLGGSVGRGVTDFVGKKLKWW